MASFATLRDDFADNLQAAAWGLSAVVGSATKAETGGQVVLTLPNATAGTHTAYYKTSLQYDLTADSFYINIGTMVATGVAATALFQLSLDANNSLQWMQLSGTLKAQEVVAGVATDRYSVAWSAATYKYLRIRESGGGILFESSTNGTAWTVRYSGASPFATTALYAVISASCGNVASPGSFRLDDVNLILPALTSAWNWQQQKWTLAHRFKVVTLAIDTANTTQGYIVTADGVDVSNAPSGNVRYWSGPLSGGRELTEQTTQAAAQAMAVNFPLDGRLDLPTMVEARVFRTYNRSIDGAAYTLREDYARRLLQADDLEAEIIRGMTILGHQLVVDNLSALTANIGQLTITNATGGAAWIYQGTGTGDTPTTGLKIFNSGGIGKLSTYNTGVEQVTLDTDGRLKAGAGTTYLDATGVSIVANTAFSTNDAYKFVDTAGGTVRANWAVYNPAGGPVSLLQLNSLAGKGSSMEFRSTGAATFNSSVQLRAQSTASNNATFTINADSTGAYIGSFTGQSAAQTEMRFEGQLNIGSGITGTGDGSIKMSGGINVNSSGASAGEIRTLRNDGGYQLKIERTSATARAYGLAITSSGELAIDDITGAARRITITAAGAIGFFGSSGTTRPAISGSRGGNAALGNLLTSLAGLGLLTDSTTA